MFQVREYVTENGRIPFREWLNGLKDKQTIARVDVRLSRIRLGNLGDYKAVGKGVFELRLPFSPGYRIYFGRSGETIILLLHGGAKGSQERDIALAQEYWQSYLRETK